MMIITIFKQLVLETHTPFGLTGHTGRGVLFLRIEYVKGQNSSKSQWYTGDI
jgi:hypothetical protein